MNYAFSTDNFKFPGGRGKLLTVKISCYWVKDKKENEDGKKNQKKERGKKINKNSNKRKDDLAWEEKWYSLGIGMSENDLLPHYLYTYLCSTKYSLF